MERLALIGERLATFVTAGGLSPVPRENPEGTVVQPVKWKPQPKARAAESLGLIQGYPVNIWVADQSVPSQLLHFNMTE